MSLEWKLEVAKQNYEAYWKDRKPDKAPGRLRINSNQDLKKQILEANQHQHILWRKKAGLVVEAPKEVKGESLTLDESIYEEDDTSEQLFEVGQNVWDELRRIVRSVAPQAKRATEQQAGQEVSSKFNEMYEFAQNVSEKPDESTIRRAIEIIDEELGYHTESLEEQWWLPFAQAWQDITRAAEMVITAIRAGWKAYQGALTGASPTLGLITAIMVAVVGFLAAHGALNVLSSWAGSLVSWTRRKWKLKEIPLTRVNWIDAPSGKKRLLLPYLFQSIGSEFRFKVNVQHLDAYEPASPWAALPSGTSFSFLGIVSPRWGGKEHFLLIKPDSGRYYGQARMVKLKHIMDMEDDEGHSIEELAKHELSTP